MLQDVEIACGDECERFIDGVWYAAKVIEVREDTINIKYNDDGKTESDIVKFSDEIRYSKFPELWYEREDDSSIAVLDLDTEGHNTLEFEEIAERGNCSMQRNLTAYRLDYNQLEYIFNRTIIPTATVWRTDLRPRSKSVDSFLVAGRTSRVLISQVAGLLFAYRPLVNSKASSHSMPDNLRSPWGKLVVDLRPLADLCVACRRTTIYKCGRCNDAFFCSKICQKQNWAHHKVFCEPKPVTALFRPNPALLSPARLERQTMLSKSMSNLGQSHGVADRYSGRNEATDASFGREGGATRRLWDKTNASGSNHNNSGTSMAATVPLFDIRTSNAAVPLTTPSSSSSSHVIHFHKISEAADDIDEQSGIHGHLRTSTLSSQSRSSHASRDTQPEQWDYTSAYQKGIMPATLAEEFGYGTSAIGSTRASAPSPVHGLLGDSGRTQRYDGNHLMNAHSSSNSMVTQDVSQSGSPVAGMNLATARATFSDEEVDLESFRRAVTPTKHLRSLDTHNITSITVGNPFGYGLADIDDDDDDDEIPSLAAVVPVPSSLAPGRSNSPNFYNTRSSSMANTTPVRSVVSLPLGDLYSEVDALLEEQIKNLVMELGLSEKSLRMALKLFPNDLDRAVEWVYDNGSDYDIEGQWM